jgi:hypothetical protein
MHESRVFILDPETVRSVSQSYNASGEFTFTAVKNLRDAIPEALSLEEVNDVGFQVSRAVEDLRPSHDGYSRGRRAEREAILKLGVISLHEGDIVTAENSKTHLRQTLCGYLNAFLLGRMIKKEKTAILDQIVNG